MEKTIGSIIIAVLMVVWGINYYRTYKYVHKKVDGVTSIDGIRYRVKNTDISYVMYKLGSTCMSKYIKEKTFEKKSDHEGILTFGGVNYNMNLRGSERDMNIGAAYRIICRADGADVLMDIAFEKRDFKWFSPSTKQPGFELNQAYHRFFKEILNVEIVNK